MDVAGGVAFLWQQLHCGKQYFCYLCTEQDRRGQHRKAQDDGMEGLPRDGILYSFVSVPFLLLAERQPSVQCTTFSAIV